MELRAVKIPYSETGRFTPIVLDYLAASEKLDAFYRFKPDLDGLKKSVEQRKKNPVNRAALLTVLREQYEALPSIEAVNTQLSLLEQENCFAIVTAHQPNLFTGPLYLIYKILHAVKLAEELNHLIPGSRFVPIYYIGSEDADFDELGHLTVEGMRRDWQTDQKGAVGRMKVDNNLVNLAKEIAGQLTVYPHGEEIMAMLQSSFVKGETIAKALQSFLHAVLGRFGLLILDPDHALLKKEIIDIMKDDLLTQQPAALVAASSEELGKTYKIQASPREINLFYLADGIRNRIVQQGEDYYVLDTDHKFSKQQILEELEQYPERFSPNVILRGLFQERIIPNICFIGGGGELAYWLQCEKLFAHYKVPYPVLMLRNSFLIIEEKWKPVIEDIYPNLQSLFQPSREIFNAYVKRLSDKNLELNGQLQAADSLYDQIGKQAALVDPTLEKHVAALKTHAVRKLESLEKKMLKAEKLRFEAAERKLEKLQREFFPSGGLQERSDNFLSYYARYGAAFLDAVLQHSEAIARDFNILCFYSE